MSTQSQHPDPSTLQALTAELETLRERVTALESELEYRDTRLEQLETALDRAQTTNDQLRTRIDNLEDAQSPVEARLDAYAKKLTANKERVTELQARELEKGAHLLETHVDETEVDVADGRLERIRKDDGRRYFRLPESDDPLGRGGNVALAHGDLLPIQQLATMDDDMLHATVSSLPSRLAARLWKARTDPGVGDNPWENGCAGVREYVTASEMKHWIRRQETGISESYAKKLVSRTIDALLDLSKNRLAIKRTRQRKNGLEYTERRVLLMEDAEIPGEGGGMERGSEAKTGSKTDTGADIDTDTDTDTDTDMDTDTDIDTKTTG
ncbi:uncharacterized protein Nmag_3622 (plasmid) [Natrialba magadii ATCC 43099]|uniref:Uncharacterized protein n=1 Tax=Natrialba magadii (strain ATCC 43099 / DSM 3394 / CCM 3739 / CIP 104546 / IAM 13178 / JCM 8861 / NBRC 102185 / NCIMB 2190 / MS3) TaxID=547559 RepID=D3T0R3_NATMM|nr:hypothetical protein [Natrialba magadii]ADD07172.1 uncharacterized protein Nmag_3622 [Natrialba magadii ATCC 43099]ELY34577.1 hypothetical protein C500_00077 [Natrialba magadii ATCC 43099]